MQEEQEEQKDNSRPRALSGPAAAVESVLFTQVKVGRYKLRNRVVMAPMTRNRSPGGLPNAMNSLYYEQRAAAGLIVTEGIWPDPSGIGYVDVPGLYSGEQIAGWQMVTSAVHARGGRIFAQILHVGRISHPNFLGGNRPLAPSEVTPVGQLLTYDGPLDYEPPRALQPREIEEVIASYGRAASRAIDAGFDGVEIHAANGYLPHQFLSANTNLRTDEYGGSPEKRARFALDVAGAAAAAVGPDRVGMRISPGNPYNDINEDESAEKTYAHLGRHVERLGLAYLHVIDSRPGYDVIGMVRSHYHGKLVANGGYDADRAAKDISAGRADLVSFGTAFLANPDLPERLRVGARLNAPDRSTFYEGGLRGYTDYPFIGDTGDPKSGPVGT